VSEGWGQGLKYLKHTASSSTDDPPKVIREADEARGGTKPTVLFGRKPAPIHPISEGLAMSPFNTPSPTKPTAVFTFYSNSPNGLSQTARYRIHSRRFRGSAYPWTPLPISSPSCTVVASATDGSANPIQIVLNDVYCLWDTGTKTSFIPTIFPSL